MREPSEEKWEKFSTDLHCSVCGKFEKCVVVSLPFGPMSESFCKECYKQEAYPLWSLMYLFVDVGNKNDSNLIEDVKLFKSFWKGNYINWEEAKKVILEYEKVQDRMNLTQFESL